MPLITFERAWRAYRRAETRLPVKAPATTPLRVEGVGAIVERFDLLILDAWGVLNLGDVPIARAVTAVGALRAAGLPLRVLSNDASGEKARAVANHRRRGYDFTAAEIVAGLDLLPDTLARLALPDPIGLIADPPVPPLPVPMQPLGDDATAYDRVSGFVFLSSDGWSEERQALLAASLLRQPRPLVVCNPDIASPGALHLNAEPGFYAHRLAEKIGIAPIFCGKPEQAIYRRALDGTGVSPERVLCVGDTLHTDILGARAAGCKAMLVEGGFLAGRDPLSLAAESGIWPDFIAPGL
ncbi:MAG TPA: HAD-IA family hydrolase [Stellaceae bacterium]|nr:HAD-IA family hydrolase [Stellaceae bacterium]